MATVLVPSALRKFTADRAEVDVAGATVGEALRDLVRQHPPLEANLYENGNLRRFVNVFLGDEDVRFLEGEATALPTDGEISIIPAVAGGF